MDPRFSTRLDWQHSENALARAETSRRATGEPLLDLTETNPTAVGLLNDDAASAIAAAFERAARSIYVPSPRGAPVARHAIANAYAAAGTTIAPDQIVLTASSSESYAYLWKLLADPGDVVLVPEPSYPLFDYLARLDGITAVPYRLTHDGTARGTWHVDLASIDNACARFGDRVRALIIVSPNNPTGSVLRQDDFTALDRRAAGHGIALIADEVFADYIYDETAKSDPDRAPIRCAAGHPTESLVFSLGGLSKSCGLPHLKLGWIAAGGPPTVVASALARLDLITDTYLSVGTPVAGALPDLLRIGTTIRAGIRERVAHNRALLAQTIDKKSSVTLLACDGGWAAILRVPAVRTDEEWALSLLKIGVLVHPGYFFDLSGATFLVVSLLPAPDVFATAVTRLLACVADSVR
jgi:alanine-synthesizing transaminase